MRVAVYPGSFDPITYGHLNIIQRGIKFFDKIVVAILQNRDKKYLFTALERSQLIKDAIRNIPNVDVDIFEGLLVDYMKKNKIRFILRGLRLFSDFEYESRLYALNNYLDNEIETVFLVSKEKYLYVSSTIVKEIASFKGDVSKFVPEEVCKKLKDKFN